MAKNHGSQIKNDEKYEALRNQGASKEKAARIANSDPKSMAENRKKSERYEEWSKDELYEKAKEIGVKNRSSMNKQELINALRH